MNIEYIEILCNSSANEELTIFWCLFYVEGHLIG
jgi:hypothetical protein